MPEDAVAVLRHVWDRQSEWSQTAGRLKQRLMRGRMLVLVLTVSGGVLALAASQFGEYGDENVGRALAFVAAAALAVVPIAVRSIGTSGVEEWTRARSVSESLKSQVFYFLLGIPPYEGAGRDARLLTEMKEVVDSAAPLAADDVPPVRRDPPSAMGIEDYIAQRILGQARGYYTESSQSAAGSARRFRRVGVFFAVVAALMAAASGVFEIPPLAAWVPVLTSATSAIAAHSASNRYDWEAIEYRRTASELEDLAVAFVAGALRNEDGSPTSVSDFVRRCEGVISSQNTRWMAKWSGAEDRG